MNAAPAPVVGGVNYAPAMCGISYLAKRRGADFVLAMSNAQILDAALRLPVRQRERVAEAILGSIAAPSQRHIAALWAQEAESRVDGLLKGKMKTRPGADVLAYRGRGGK